MNRLAAIILVTLAWPAAGLAGEIQTDWSAGAVQSGPVPAWDNAFETSVDVSWLSIPGQIALSADGLLSPTKHTLATGHSGAFGIEAVDLNGDGDVDVIGAAETAGTLTVWHNDGANPPTFTSETIATGFSAISAVFAADMDGDLDLDLVACSGSISGRVTCYFNGGESTPTWTAQNVDSSWGEAWEIAAGDVNSDGNMDVIGTSLSGDSVAWWKNDGQTPIGWTRILVDATVDGAHSARVGDLNGDGHADVLGVGTLNDEVVWWQNGGDVPITWTKHVIETPFIGGRSVRMGDIDGDGDPDVGAVGFNGRVQWWSNEGGDPVVWTPQIVASWGQVHQLQLADVNGDGRLDMVS